MPCPHQICGESNNTLNRLVALQLHVGTLHKAPDMPIYRNMIEAHQTRHIVYSLPTYAEYR